MFIRKRKIVSKLAEQQLEASQNDTAKNAPQRFFTLEEAAAMLPVIQEEFEQFQQECLALQDDVVLYKRIAESKERSNIKLSEADLSILKNKWEALDSCVKRWRHYFSKKGLLVRQLERGLIDFPYRTQKGETLCLCWEYGEDGVLHFHLPEEGYAGRKPITLLPE